MTHQIRTNGGITMDKQTWDEWIAEHGSQVVEYTMVCLTSAKQLWDRAVRAEEERDEAQKKLGFAIARIAELEAAQAKDRESYASTKLHNIALRDELIAIRAPWGERTRPLEITDEMVKAAAKAIASIHYPGCPWDAFTSDSHDMRRNEARAAINAVKDQLAGSCPECAEKDKRIAAILEQHAVSIRRANMWFDRMEEQRIRANRLESDCDAKVERITELEVDALAMETEMLQARRRIKALEAVLRENRKWCEQGRYWGPMAIIDKHLKDHSVTLPDTDADAPATREPEPEPVGDDELREKIDSKLHALLPHAARATVCIITDEILSLIGPRLTPETQERLAYLEREHRKFCEMFNDYSEEEIVEEFQTRLAHGDAAIKDLSDLQAAYTRQGNHVLDVEETRDKAIAVLREMKAYLESCNPRSHRRIVALPTLCRMMSDHGILDLITGEQDGACADCPDSCPGDCDTCGDTAICPQAPVNPVDRVPLPDYLDPSTDDWEEGVCAINAIINHLADRERADTRTGAAPTPEED